MFRIVTKENKLVGYTNELNYIKISPTSGCYIKATKEEAVGIAFKGVAYNLPGHTEVNGDVVYVITFDEGSLIEQLNTQVNNTEKTLSDIDVAAIQIYEQNLELEKIIAEQDEALIQLYELFGGKNNG